MKIDSKILFLPAILPVFVSRTVSTIYTLPFEDTAVETVN